MVSRPDYADKWYETRFDPYKDKKDAMAAARAKYTKMVNKQRNTQVKDSLLLAIHATKKRKVKITLPKLNLPPLEET